MNRKDFCAIDYVLALLFFAFLGGLMLAIGVGLGVSLWMVLT